MTSPVVSMTRAEFIVEFGYEPRPESEYVEFVAPNGGVVLRIKFEDKATWREEVARLEKLYSLVDPR